MILTTCFHIDEYMIYTPHGWGRCCANCGRIERVVVEESYHKPIAIQGKGPSSLSLAAGDLFGEEEEK